MDKWMNGKFQAKKNFIHRKVAKRDVLIPIGGNVANFNGFIEVNDTALFLWEHLKEPCTGTQLCAALVEEYDVTPEEAAEDVAAFLEKHVNEQMIEEIQDESEQEPAGAVSGKRDL